MPRDNSNNLFDNSGQLIIFNTNDVSNNSFSLYNLFDSSDNANNDPLEQWRREKLAFLLKLLEEDTETPGKRLRSSSADNTNMSHNTRSHKKQRPNILIDSLDNHSQPPPVVNISPSEPLNVFLSVCDKEYPSDDMMDPYLNIPNPIKTPEIIKEKVDICMEINGLDDLLKLIKTYPLVDNVEYNIDMVSLHKIEPSLQDLHGMIGMNGLKDHVVDQIIYYLQGFHEMGECGDFMHTVIYGPPGTGKTEVAKIIGAIFSKLGVLPNNSFKKVTRADLIAGYLGQTALKTRDVIKDAMGGVLFIDEAYALGNPEKKDSFAKECIDTLCDALSDHKDKLMVIIAGYEKELKDCFFAFNQGLDSRFTWRFKTDDYKPEELMQIFNKKIHDAKWSVDDNALKKEWFEKNADYFKYFGRDMETLFAKVKISHSRRVFCLPKDQKTTITMKDMDNGLELYLANDEVKTRKDGKEIDRRIMQSMYV